MAAMLVSGIVGPPVNPGGTVQPEEGKQAVSHETQCSTNIYSLWIDF